MWQGLAFGLASKVIKAVAGGGKKAGQAVAGQGSRKAIFTWRAILAFCVLLITLRVLFTPDQIIAILAVVFG